MIYNNAADKLFMADIDSKQWIKTYSTVCLFFLFSANCCHYAQNCHLTPFLLSLQIIRYLVTMQNLHILTVTMITEPIQ